MVAHIGGNAAESVRLASKSLLHAPWSPDGKRLLFLGNAATATQTASAGAEFVGLFAVGADGGDPALVGPPSGIVDAASYLPDGRILYLYRSGRGGKESLWTVDPAQGNQASLLDLAEDTTAVDLATSADGKWGALVTLSGPRDEKVRGLAAVDLSEKKLTAIAAPSAAYFVTWAGGTLLFNDENNGERLMMWKPGDAAPTLAAQGGVRVAIGVLDGSMALGERSDAGNGLALIDLVAHEMKPIAARFVPTSAAGGKLALVRCTPEGAAILVTDISKESLGKGDLGLPPGASEVPAPPAPPAPPPAPAPDAPK
jgi:Tol biopolymer transport system component